MLLGGEAGVDRPKLHESPEIPAQRFSKGCESHVLLLAHHVPSFYALRKDIS